MKLCYDCAHVINTDQTVCPYCGADTRADPSPREAYHLTPGQMLKNYRYIVGRALGYGGFGVTYAGFDALLEKRVAIKEFLPGELATRLPGTVKVSVFPGEATETQFISGLQSFMDEAERLAKFNSVDSIVNIFDCFVENDTAYLVMELLDGQTLKSYLDERGRLPYNEALEIMIPVLDALRQVHSQGIIHRDISPDNIFLTNDGRVKVLDFGASRYASAISEKSLSVILKYGYAPKEQYTTRGDQGPWSDVYAAGATLYRMLTGRKPDDALERAAHDTLIPPSKLGVKLPKNAETAILNALNVEASCRTRSAEELLDQLRSTVTVVRYTDVKGKKPWSLPKWVYWLLAGVLSAGAAFAALLLTGVISFGTPAISRITSGNITVPNIIGMTEDEVHSAQPEWELRTVGSDVSEDVAVGCIMAQDPGFGDSVPPGTPIDIIVNRGVETAAGIMPYLRGESLEAARGRLAGANISVRYEYDRSVVSGRVKGSAPSAGAEFRDGDGVELIVSRGGLLEDVRFDYEGSTIELDIRSGRAEVPYTLIPANIEDGKCSVVCASENESVARFVDGIFTPTGVGETYITVTASMRDEFTGRMVTVSDRRRVVVTRAAAAPTVSPDSPDAIVMFSDAAFERAVRQACGFGPVVRNRDLWQVKKLVLNDLGLTDISDVAKFRNLFLLELKNNRITDVSPIGELHELTTLMLNNNRITDISSLGTLGKLRALELRENDIADISPLAGLTELTALGLQKNRIGNIAPLAGLTKLESLILADNPITQGYEALSGLVNMKKLYLNSTGIEDLTPLAGMTGLEVLHATGNRISDISPIIPLPKLNEVELRSSGVDRRQYTEYRAMHPNGVIE